MKTNFDSLDEIIATGKYINTTIPNAKVTEYKYSEYKTIQELKDYIDSTYDEHYSKNKYQATEFIIDAGHGEGFCIGNIMKYAQRYGKKGGKNRKDILKILHYGMILLHIHDSNVDNSNTP